MISMFPEMNLSNFVFDQDETLQESRLTFPSQWQLMAQNSMSSTIPVTPHPTSSCHNSSKLEPTDQDVTCGRGKGSYNRPGNRRFRDIVHRNMPSYLSCSSKLDKTIILNTIIAEVQLYGGRFLKHTKKEGWFEISDEQAREKVGHAMREAISSANKNADKQEGEVTRKEGFHNKQSSLLDQQQEMFTRFMEDETGL